MCENNILGVGNKGFLLNKIVFNFYVNILSSDVLMDLEVEYKICLVTHYKNILAVEICAFEIMKGEKQT